MYRQEIYQLVKEAYVLIQGVSSFIPKLIDIDPVVWAWRSNRYTTSRTHSQTFAFIIIVQYVKVTNSGHQGSLGLQPGHTLIIDDAELVAVCRKNTLIKFYDAPTSCRLRRHNMSNL